MAEARDRQGRHQDVAILGLPGAAQNMGARPGCRPAAPAVLAVVWGVGPGAADGAHPAPCGLGLGLPRRAGGVPRVRRAGRRASPFHHPLPRRGITVAGLLNRARPTHPKGRLDARQRGAVRAGSGGGRPRTACHTARAPSGPSVRPHGERRGRRGQRIKTNHFRTPTLGAPGPSRRIEPLGRSRARRPDGQRTRRRLREARPDY